MVREHIREATHTRHSWVQARSLTYECTRDNKLVFWISTPTRPTHLLPIHDDKLLDISPPHHRSTTLH